jgi:hypothetical protein
MRPWAQWTAKTALLAAGLAAAAGLSGVALAAGSNRNISLGSGNTVTAPISAPVNVCGVSGAVGRAIPPVASRAWGARGP